jgi:hypothetical protein
MSRKKSKYIVIPGNGDPCQTCGQPTQIREHDAIREKHLAQPYYFTRWFNCTNPKCRTNIQHRDRYKVWNKHERDKETVESDVSRWEDYPGNPMYGDTSERPPWE